MNSNILKQKICSILYIASIRRQLHRTRTQRRRLREPEEPTVGRVAPRSTRKVHITSLAPVLQIWHRQFANTQAHARVTRFERARRTTQIPLEILLGQFDDAQFVGQRDVGRSTTIRRGHILRHTQQVIDAHHVRSRPVCGRRVGHT